MKKEFKFIKGVYTENPLFNDDIRQSLLILDELGDPIDFEAVDNKETQDALIRVSDNNVCKLYTVTSNQITVEGTLKAPNTYNFTACAKDQCESGEKIPEIALNRANDLLKTGLQANLSNLDKSKISIGKDSEAEDVKVNITYNENKVFTKQMKFRVEGDVNVKTLENLTKLTFCSIDDVYCYDPTDKTYTQYNNSIKFILFEDGKKQKIDSKQMEFPISTFEVPILPGILPTLNEIKVKVANNYALSNMYTFKVNGDFVRTASYKQLANNLENERVYIYDENKMPSTSFILPQLEETILLDDNITDKMYIENGDNGYTKLNKGEHFEKTMTVYDINNLSEENDSKIYKKVTENKSLSVNTELVTLTDLNVIAPVITESQIVTIDPEKVTIIARES